MTNSKKTFAKTQSLVWPKFRVGMLLKSWTIHRKQTYTLDQINSTVIFQEERQGQSQEALNNESDPQYYINENKTLKNLACFSKGK